VIAGPEALFDHFADVFEREGGQPFVLDIGTVEHGGLDLLLLLGVEPARTA